MNLFPFLSATRDHARPWFTGFATIWADTALCISIAACCAMWAVVGWVVVATI